MTTRKSSRAPWWLAIYLRRWWPNATPAGFGARGSDVKNTKGVVWEIKTGKEFKPTGFVAQAKAYAGGQLPIVVYVPNGVGEKSIEFALAIVPVHLMMDLLVEAGYTPTKEAIEA